MELKNSLNAKYDICHKSLTTLHDAIELFENTDEISQPKQHLAFQDSVIKRFEYSLDITWKYIKEYLNTKFGVTVKSPKETFREAFKQNLLSEKNTEVALKMVDDRNDTTHRYDNAVAQEICKKIPAYYATLKLLLKNAQPK